MVQYSIPPKALRFGTQNLKVAKGLIFPVLGTLFFSVLKPYFPCTGDFVFLCTGTLCVSMLGPYFPCTGDFVFLCTGTLFSLCWGLCISLYWALFFLCWGLYVWYRYENGEKILEIFKGSEGPYRIENAGPWGGYTVRMKPTNEIMAKRFVYVPDFFPHKLVEGIL